VVTLPLRYIKNIWKFFTERLYSNLLLFQLHSRPAAALEIVPLSARNHAELASTCLPSRRTIFP